MAAKRKQKDNDIDAYIRMLDGSIEGGKTSPGSIEREKWRKPNVFIGLGSTGVGAVHRIAQRLRSIQFEQFDNANIPQCLQFIGFDTATPTSDIRDFIRFQCLEIRDLDYMFDKDKEIFNKLGFHEGGISIKGPAAGGKRKFGRFAFLAHADVIKKEIESALAMSRNFPGIGGNEIIRVHLCTSLAGGTGCGAFLDLAFLIKSITESFAGNIEVNAYIMLPDDGVSGGSIDHRTYASAAAALKDLEYFMQLGAGGFRGMPGAPQAGDRIDYKHDGSIFGTVGKPFNYCYLAGGRGQGLGSIETIEQFEASIAESVLRNAIGDTAKWHLEKVPDDRIAKYLEMDRRGKYNVFSAIGYSRCMTPISQLKGYLALSMAKEFCNFMVTYNNSDRSLHLQDGEVFRGFMEGLKLPADIEVSRSAMKQVELLPSTLANQMENGKEGKKKVTETIKKLNGYFNDFWMSQGKAIQKRMNTKLKELADRIDRDIVFDWQEAFNDDIERLRYLEGKFNVASKKANEAYGQALTAWNSASTKKASDYFAKGLFNAFFKQKRLNALLKGDMEACVAAFKVLLVAKFNKELMEQYVKVIGKRRQMLEGAESRLMEIEERWERQLVAVRASLSKLEYGRVLDDCQTFSLIEPAEVIEISARKVEEWKRTLQHDIERLTKPTKTAEAVLDVADIFSEDEKKHEDFRLQVLRIALNDIDGKITNIKAELKEQTDSNENTKLVDTIKAAGPLLMFRQTRPAVVSCYSKSFKADMINKAALNPPDVALARKTNCDFLIQGEFGDKECWEVTRFFHGINLADLELAKTLSNNYYSYTKGLENKRGAVKVDDEINIFDGLEHWTPPGEEAPGTKKELPKRLWALGLCFAEVFAPSAHEKKQLLAAKKKQGKPGGKSNRKNFIFKVGHNYYLQPPYSENDIAAAELLEMGKGRDKAFAQFKATMDAVDRMKEWYQRIEQSWTRFYRDDELIKAIRDYIDGIISNKQAGDEIDVLQDFINDPFPEDYLE